MNTPRVIVGVDGSEQALAAVRVAAVEAERRKTQLHVVHAFIWPSLHVGVGPVADDMPGTGLRHHAEDLVAEAVTAAREAAPGVPVSTAIIDGAATPVLLAESNEAALLVLGDRGLGAISGLIIGSVAVHAAAHAHCPVLVVRDSAPADGPVVVGVDGSAHSQLALGFAFEASSARRAELVPVLVWPERAPDPDGRLLLGESLAGWQERFPDVVVRPELLRGNPRHALVERAKNAQLVVVGARGRDTFKGLVLGSVSQTLLYHAASPVAVVRASLAPQQADGPLDNVDEFIDRPVNAIAALLPDRQNVDDVLEALRADGTDVSEVLVLHGPEGVHILDADGTEHGWRARFIRFFQNWGYDDAVLNLHHEGLRKGEWAVVIPSSYEERIAIARMLHRHRGHAIHYFGLNTAESLSGP